MKSLKQISRAAFVAMTALVIAGCGHKDGDSHAHGEAEVGVTFNAKKGLLVPSATAKFIGLQVTDGLYAGDQIVVQPVMTLWMAELQSLRGGKVCSDGQ